MLALLFLGLCYAALSVKLLALRTKASIDFTFFEECIFPVWIVASVYVFACFVLFLGTL